MSYVTIYGMRVRIIYTAHFKYVGIYTEKWAKQQPTEHRYYILSNLFNILNQNLFFCGENEVRWRGSRGSWGRYCCYVLRACVLAGTFWMILNKKACVFVMLLGCDCERKMTKWNNVWSLCERTFFCVPNWKYTKWVFTSLYRTERYLCECLLHSRKKERRGSHGEQINCNFNF